MQFQSCRYVGGAAECTRRGSGRFLITGVGGFIGRRLVQQLVADSRFVVGIARRNWLGQCDRFFEADITKELAPDPFRGIDTVFHLAGKSHALAEVKEDDEEYFRVNSLGTRHVLEAARAAGVRRFVFFSSVKAMSRDLFGFGDRESDGKRKPMNFGSGRALTEADVLEPDTPYGRSKLEAERLVLHGNFVAEPVVLRLCMVYGAGSKGNLQRMLCSVRRGHFPPIPEIGNRRSMVHVQDVVRAAFLAAERPEAIGQVFIVSDGRCYSTRQIYEMMCRALKRRIPNWCFPLALLGGMARVGDIIGRIRGKRFVIDSRALAKLTGYAWFSSEKLQRVLDFQPEWDLEKALPEMVAQMDERPV